MSELTNEEKIKILSDIVAIKTVNDNEIEVAKYLKKLFDKYGIDSHIDKLSKTRANLIASIGFGKPVIGVSGHMDVVDEGNHDEWTYDPFTLTENDGYLYARGAADMKSGLAALAISLIEIKKSDRLKNGTIKFMATVGEEIEQAGSKQLYDKGYTKDLDALVIAEPSYPSLVYSHKGSMDFKITSMGKSSHSSVPFLGKNAITPLIAFIETINSEYESLRKTIKSNSLDYSNMIDELEGQLPNDISKEEARDAIESLVITNSVINGGKQVNSVADSAFAEFNVRTLPEYNNDKVKELFNKYINEANENGANLSQEIYLDLLPVVTTGKNKLVELGIKKAQEHFKDEKAFITCPTTAVTDASNLLRDKDENFPFLMFGPGQDPHQVNECVDKNNYLEFIDYYIDLLISFASEY
jgi:peptidase, argE/dapE family